MKRIIAALVLLAVSGLVSVCSLSTVAKVQDEITGYTEQIISMEEPEDAERIIEELTEHWEKSYSKLAVFVSHQHLEDTEKFVCTLKAAVKLDNAKQVKTLCVQINGSLDHLLRAEYPYPDNIF